MCHICHPKVKGLLLLRENPLHAPGKDSRMNPGLRQMRAQILAELHLPYKTSGKSLPITELHSLLCKEQKSLPPGVVLWTVCHAQHAIVLGYG